MNDQVLLENMNDAFITFLCPNYRGEEAKKCKNSLLYMPCKQIWLMRLCHYYFRDYKRRERAPNL